MKLRNTFFALMMGKKVRQTWWAPGAYYFLDRQDDLVDEFNEKVYEPCFHLNDGWEVFREAKVETQVQGDKDRGRPY